MQEALLALGARRWQAEIATPILEQALTEREPLEIPEPASEGEAAAEE
jgi:ribonuclease D